MVLLAEKELSLMLLLIGSAAGKTTNLETVVIISVPEVAYP